MSDITITGLPLASGIDASADWFAIDRTSLDTTQRINRNTMLGITGSPVGTTDSQTLTNKIITSPTITILDNAFTIQDNSDPTKQAQFQASGITAGQTRTYTLPDGSTTLVGTGLTQTLTDKTLTSPVITGGSITGSTITSDAIVGQTDADSGTIYGVGITNSKISGASLSTGSVPTAALADTSVTPAKLQTGTGSSWAWQSWTPTFANFTKGSATITAKYTQIGKAVMFRLSVTLAADSSMGTSPTFTLPVTATTISETNVQILGQMTIGDSGTATYYGIVQFVSTTVARMILADDAAPAIRVDTTITATVPMTWTTSDTFHIIGFYEAA